MTQEAAVKPAPNLKFAHMGLVVSDIEVMTRFYVDVLGFTVTDRGVFGAMDVVFMSRDPEEHHQIVLTTGRPRNLTGWSLASRPSIAEQRNKRLGRHAANLTPVS